MHYYKLWYEILNIYFDLNIKFIKKFIKQCDKNINIVKKHLKNQNSVKVYNKELFLEELNKSLKNAIDEYFKLNDCI